MKTQIRSLLTLVCAASASLLSLASPAQAGYIVTLDQVGANVVATGTGALDVTGLSLSGTSNASAQMVPNQGIIETGQFGMADFYHISASGPANFGTGSHVVPNSTTGAIVGNPFIAGLLFVPQGYASNSALSDSATYDSATFSSLGVTPGTYEWTWGTGVNQNFTVQIGPAGVPDAGSTLGLLALALAALFGASRFRVLRLA